MVLRKSIKTRIYRELHLEISSLRKILELIRGFNQLEHKRINLIILTNLSMSIISQLGIRGNEEE